MVQRLHSVGQRVGIGDERHLEICPFSGVSLSDTANAEVWSDLLEMSESRAEEIDRISCEEEERVSKGYDIETLFSIDGGERNRVKRAVLKSSESDLINIRYIPAARLIHVNRKWRATHRRSQPDWHSAAHWSRRAAPGLRRLHSSAARRAPLEPRWR